MQETTNWCFQFKCKQKYTKLYLVNRICRYQTSGLSISNLLCAPFSRSWIFPPCLSWEAEKTGLTGSLMKSAAPSPPPANFCALFECKIQFSPFWQSVLTLRFVSIFSQLECFDTWRWQSALKRTGIPQEHDGVIKFSFFKDWHVVAFPLTFVSTRQIGITSWQSTISNMIKQHSLEIENSMIYT